MVSDNLPDKGNNGGDRREYERFTCMRFACSCFVSSESENGSKPGGRLGGALLSNVSLDGINFEANFMPSKGDYLLLDIRPIEGPDLSARIKVLHTRRSDKNGFFAIGSKVEEISERDRRNLLQLIATIKRMRQNLSA